MSERSTTHHAQPAEPEKTGYPPKAHLLRDMRLSLSFQSEERATIRAPVVPQVCSDNGSIHLGVLATLTDVLGGFLSMATFAPDWMATANLSIHLSGRIASGGVYANGNLIHSGRTTATAGAEIFSDTCSIAAGFAMMRYAKIEGVRPGMWTGATLPRSFDFEWPDGSSGLHRHIVEQAGLKTGLASPGSLLLEMDAYIRNSFGALQGGVIALMAEVAGQAAACAAAGSRLSTTDMELHYLAPGRIGPFTTAARVLRSNKASALTRIEVNDAGDEGRLIAVALTHALRQETSVP